MNCLVTGVAGFIGSHLAEKLIFLGHRVTGIDCFTDYYSRKIKEQNISKLLKEKKFIFKEDDLLSIDLNKLLKKIDIIFHQAAQAGVRKSWEAFETYVQNNILVTQKLLEAAKNSSIKKFIYASSSSIYGDINNLPMKEESIPHPISPYGVTKLSTEHLCKLFTKIYKVPIIILRYFTVYGPRQRPDMAFHKFIKAILEDKEITIFGDGSQTRDFTYISDAVEANILSMESKLEEEIFNIGGGSQIQLKETIKILQEIIGKKAKIKYVETQKGDMKHTAADIEKAKRILGYKPTIPLEEGLIKEVNWIKNMLQYKQ